MRGLATAALGSFTLVLLLGGFYGIKETIIGDGSLELDVSGYDLATGTWHILGMSLPLKFSEPFIWLIIGGALMVTILGLAVAGGASAEPIGALAMISGLLALAGSLLTVTDLAGKIESYYTTISGYTVYVETIIGWEVFASLIIAFTCIFLGAEIRAKGRELT